VQGVTGATVGKHMVGLRVVKGVSPKLLLDRDPALHLPLPADS